MSDINAKLFDKLYAEDADSKVAHRMEQVPHLAELTASLGTSAKQAETAHAEQQKKIAELEKALKETKEEFGNLQHAAYQNCQRILKEIEVAKLELVKSAPSYIQLCRDTVLKEVKTLNTTGKMQAVNKALTTFNDWYYQAIDFAAMNAGFKKAIEEVSPSNT